MNKSLVALAVATALVGLSGCATTLPGTGSSPVGVVSAGPAIQFNGMRLQPVAQPRVPGLEAMPFDGSLEDVAALRKSLNVLNARRTAALLAGDFELAAVHNSVHAQLAAFRMGVNLSNRDALAQLQHTKGERFKMAPGSVVVLMAQPAGRDMQVTLNNPVEGLFDRYEGVQVADAAATLGALSEALRIMNAATNAASARGVVSGRATSMFGMDEIPENIPFAMDNGTILVRRNTPLGATYSFYNPTSVESEVSLKSVAYVPPPPPLSRLRQQAAPIMVNMAAGVRADYESLVGKYPNKLPLHVHGVQMYSNGPSFGPDGRVTSDPAQINRAIALNKSSSTSYARAAFLSGKVHLFANNTGCDTAFSDYYAWLTSGKKGPPPRGIFAEPFQTTPMISYTGPHAAYVSLECLRRQDKTPVYRQNFFVGEESVVQTAYSLITDRRVADQIQQMDSYTEAVADVSGIIPVVGSVTSALRCLNPRAEDRAHLFSVLQSRSLSGQRGFVRHLYDVSLNKDEGLLGETLTYGLDCTAMIPGFGTGAKLSQKALDVLNITWTRGGAKRFQEMAHLFDAPVLNTQQVKLVYEAGGASSGKTRAAIKTGVALHSTLQRADNMADFFSGMLYALQ